MNDLFLFKLAAAGFLDRGGHRFTPWGVREGTLPLLREILTLLSVVSGFRALPGYYTQRRVVIPYRRLPCTLHNVPEECKSNFV